MKAFLQDMMFKLDTVWWDISKGDNRYIWCTIVAISTAAGTLLGKTL